MKTAVNAQIDHKPLPWQQQHQLERWAEKSSASGTGSRVVWASLPAELQLLWDQQGAQLEQVHPWSFTAYPFKIKGDASPYSPAFCYKLKTFSNSVLSVLLLRKIVECLGSGALAYPRLSSTGKGGSRDRPWLCLTREVFSLYITCHPLSLNELFIIR